MAVVAVVVLDMELGVLEQMVEETVVMVQLLELLVLQIQDLVVVVVDVMSLQEQHKVLVLAVVE
jgi:hypothetical protein